MEIDDRALTSELVSAYLDTLVAGREAREQVRTGLSRYAQLLSEQAIVRGFLGPREETRLWSRHILNCATLAPLLPRAGRVVDAGTGAGLPGVVLAILRPELVFELVDSMQRRTDWLQEIVTELGLGNTTVTRARIEELPAGENTVVVSRAVAPVDKLAAWTVHLLRGGGEFLALKGASAREELAASRKRLSALGLQGATVQELATLPGLDPTYVVAATKDQR
jgi:16S rRNA (guanine527-N7)-methyltransferase